MKKSLLWRSLAMLGLVLTFTLPSLARARDVTIVFVDPPTGAGVTEVVARLSAELQLAGFGVRLLPVPPEAEVQGGSLLAGSDALALILVAADGSGLRATLWVRDRTASTSRATSDEIVARQVSFEPSQSPSVLAVRAAELLQASLLELSQPPRTEPKRPVTVTPQAPEKKPQERLRFSAAAELEVLVNAPRLRAAFLPALALGYAPSAHWSIGVSVAGLGTSNELRSSIGSAELRQGLATASLHYRPWVAGALVPRLGLSAGAYSVRAASEASTPYRGKNVTFFGAAVLASAGAELHLSRRLGLVADAGALFSLPSPQFHFDGVHPTRLGQPALALQCGALLWF